jgi:hypothetical protein
MLRGLWRQSHLSVGVGVAHLAWLEFLLAAHFEIPPDVLTLAFLLLALLLLALAPRLPAAMGEGTRWVVDRMGLLFLLVAPIVPGIGEAIVEPTTQSLLLEPDAAGQLALLVGAFVFGLRGWRERPRWLLAVSGFQLYALYVWMAVEREIEAVQAYSVPLALLFGVLAWLFPRQRKGLELCAVLALLLPAAMQSLSEGRLMPTLLLGGWGLLLVVLGISLRRRFPVTAGAAALILAALRQLWELATTLPPGVVIGAVGLVIMVLAVLLTLQRDALLRLPGRAREMLERLESTEDDGRWTMDDGTAG